MKANEFVKKFGWEEASEIVAGVPSKYMECYYSTLHWCNRNKKYSDRFKPRIDLVNIADLKRLVESYELINGLGGYEKAKKAFDELCEHEKDLITCSRVVLTKNELSDALLEYRRANNIFEMDDYIIHDGELKVFAMWSTAIEGCAYIGYAYAEDGEMADKGEFRHATDEEIEAGKRLESLKEDV